MGDELVVLGERIIIKEEIDALSRSELAALVLTSYSFNATADFGLGVTTL